MKISQVGIQLYTLRDYLQTPQEIAKTLQKVRRIGYEVVQISGMGPIDEKELGKMLKGEGLICVATHEPGAKILDEPQAIVERLNRLNCKYTAYPYPAGIDLTNRKSVQDLAAGLNTAGKVLQEAGMTLTYHNHSMEFQRIDGELVLDLIYNHTDPRYLQGEIDIFWVQHGGGNPVAWCEKLQGRLPLLHLKDYVIRDGNVPTYAEIGFGNLDWKAIISAAEKSGCQWFFVEQDTCPGSPFDSIQMSYDYIREHLCT